MFIRKHYRRVNGKRQAYWALVESYRTESGPRQRVVAYLGEMDESGRLGVKGASEGNASKGQTGLFNKTEPEWVEVDTSSIRVERAREFGGSWLGLEIMKKLGLKEHLETSMERGREEIPWYLMSLVLVLGRLCEPSSELSLAEKFYERSALSDLLGIPAEKINDDRLYRALDALLPHKEALEKYLADKLGSLFNLEYDLLLYDLTSTYFEGQCEKNSDARLGYSRDHRPDCKQVVIAMVVSRDGMPLGYEVFPGNRSDMTTVEEIVKKMEERYGRSNRVWVMDRGMTSEENLEFMREGQRRYILGTPKSQMKRFESELLSDDWARIRDGLEVKICPSPDGDEVFILCRSSQRREKEKAIHERFEKRIVEGLEKIKESCQKRKNKTGIVERRIGRLLEKNSRAAGLFKVDVNQRCGGGCDLVWSKVEAWREWAQLSEGCYVLRSNVTDWSPEDLWRAYTQLTEAENAFRIHKSDLAIRPVWHQKPQRVRAHILVCFLAFVLWKTLAELCRQAGLGNEPRVVLDELKEIRVVDVVMKTRKGVEIRRRCVARPTDHQAILLGKLGLSLPPSFNFSQRVVEILPLKAHEIATIPS